MNVARVDFFHTYIGIWHKMIVSGNEWWFFLESFNIKQEQGLIFAISFSNKALCHW